MRIGLGSQLFRYASSIALEVAWRFHAGGTLVGELGAMLFSGYSGLSTELLIELSGVLHVGGFEPAALSIMSLRRSFGTIGFFLSVDI